MNSSMIMNEQSGQCEVAKSSTLIQSPRMNTTHLVSPMCSEIQVASIPNRGSEPEKVKLAYPKTDQLPFISCMTLSYGRHEHLEESIEMFLRQEYKGRKQMVVFSDLPEQTLIFNHPEVKIINWPTRLGSMGECRNRCIEACDGDVIVLFDDDDLFLPGYLNQMAQGINGYGFVRHKGHFHLKNFEIESIVDSAGVWIAFRKEAWRAVGGYSAMNAGDDQDIMAKLRTVTTENIIQCEPHNIQFGYGWGCGLESKGGYGVYHMSGQGSDKPGAKSGNQRMTEHVQREMAAGRVPNGEIKLRPHWRKDWVRHASEFVGTLYKPAKAQETPILSILINVLNDQEEINATIKSIRETAGYEVEIIVVDDFSDKPVVLDDKTAVLHRNPQRYGCGASRHLAAIYATGEYLLIIDCHMRFERGWYQEALKRIVPNPNVVYCAQCMGLSEGNMRIIHDGPICLPAKEARTGEIVSWGKGRYRRTLNGWQNKENKDEPEIQIGDEELVGFLQTAPYTGATMNFYGADRHKPDKTQVFEGVWRDHHVDDQEIPCLMGASYFVHRALFFRLGGLKQLRMWGSDEPYFSLKVWLAGYEVRILRTVRIGHKFQSHTYKTESWTGLYNKIRCCMTLFSKEESLWFIERCKELFKPDTFARAMLQIKYDFVEIVETHRQYQKLFVRDLKWYCERHKIKYPIDTKV